MSLRSLETYWSHAALSAEQELPVWHAAKRDNAALGSMSRHPGVYPVGSYRMSARSPEQIPLEYSSGLVPAVLKGCW